MNTADVLVVGAGVVGLSTAWTLARRHPESRIVVLEKEDRVGCHASGRNSGVLHAGFYYTADSLKARYSVEGCAAWKAFCEEERLTVHRCGKLVVARTAADHAGLDTLLARGAANGVNLEDLTEAEARQIEPRVRTVGRALYSPDTATVDPTAIMAALAQRCRGAGVEIEYGARFVGMDRDVAETSVGPIAVGRVLNAAGLYADRVADAFGCGQGYRLVPFRGAYLVSAQGAPPLSCCIYPVPDLGMPFLGVHLTTTPSGHTKIGPTAFPARWREDYGEGGFRPDEVVEQLRNQASLLTRNPEVRRLALREAPKLSRRWLVSQATALADDVALRHYPSWGRRGIRAQLVHVETGRLEMDFVLEEGERSLHVLNAISPAFTCALPFSEALADRVEALAP